LDLIKDRLVWKDMSAAADQWAHAKLILLKYYSHILPHLSFSQRRSLTAWRVGGPAAAETSSASLMMLAVHAVAVFNEFK